MRINENNIVSLKGQIYSEFQFSHESYGEKFYKTVLDIERTSGNHDFIPIMISDRIINTKDDLRGMFVDIKGDFRSRNYRDKDGKSHCALLTFAKEWDELEYDEYDNAIELKGYICKKNSFRTTPLGKEITDFVFAVHRQYGKSDYIPCITWGRNAKFTDILEIGSHIKINGRIQSRKYEKTIDGGTETRMAYEVSVVTIEVIEDEKTRRRSDG